MNDRPIGVFDSGFGGLTVARAMIDLLPGEHIVYIGDTENKFVHLEAEHLAKLGVTLDSAAKIPDVIVHYTARACFQNEFLSQSSMAAK